MTAILGQAAPDTLIYIKPLASVFKFPVVQANPGWMCHRFHGKPLPIGPGVVASVSVITGNVRSSLPFEADQ